MRGLTAFRRVPLGARSVARCSAFILVTFLACGPSDVALEDPPTQMTLTEIDVAQALDTSGLTSVGMDSVLAGRERSWVIGHGASDETVGDELVVWERVDGSFARQEVPSGLTAVLHACAAPDDAAYVFVVSEDGPSLMRKSADSDEFVALSDPVPPAARQIVFKSLACDTGGHAWLGGFSDYTYPDSPESLRPVLYHHSGDDPRAWTPVALPAELADAPGYWITDVYAEGDGVVWATAYVERNPSYLELEGLIPHAGPGILLRCSLSTGCSSSYPLPEGSDWELEGVVRNRSGRTFVGFSTATGYLDGSGDRWSLKPLEETTYGVWAVYHAPSDTALLFWEPRSNAEHPGTLAAFDAMRQQPLRTDTPVTVHDFALGTEGRGLALSRTETGDTTLYDVVVERAEAATAQP